MPRDDERELEEGIARGLERPDARRAFRDALRARFAAGPVGADADSRSDVSSSSHGAEAPRRAGAPMIEEALKRIPTPRARAAFKSAIREEFASAGAAVSRAAAAQTRAQAAPGESVTRRAARSDRPARGGRSTRPAPVAEAFSSGPFSWQVTVGLLAVAAAVVLLLWVPVEKDAPVAPRLAWDVTKAGAALEFDGRRMVADTGGFSRAFGAARTVATLTEPVVFKLYDRVRFGMESRSLLRLPASVAPFERPEELDDASEELTFELESGTLHMMTRPGADVATVVVRTPHSTVRITASTVSIEVIAGKGTCICVDEGDVEVEVLAGEAPPIHVTKDSTCFVFEEAGVPVRRGASEDVVPAAHLEPLRAFHAEGLARF
jgi:hypothetical protein